MATAMSPDGGHLYITGLSWNHLEQRVDIATVAYDASTGSEVWTARYGSPGDASFGLAIASSSDGSRVYVTGSQNGRCGECLALPGQSRRTTRNPVTLAYDAGTGEQLWDSVEPAVDGDALFDHVVPSSDGSAVYVSGRSCSQADVVDSCDLVLVSYDATTGTQKWRAAYDNGAYDVAARLEFDPDGETLYVTGSSRPRPGFDAVDFYTAAHDVATGAQLWSSRYRVDDLSFNQAFSLEISPEGEHLYVTGMSIPRGGESAGSSEYATVAYGTATGVREWVTRYRSPARVFDASIGLVLSPDGKRLFVTGVSFTPGSSGVRQRWDALTVSYEAATGALVWEQGYRTSSATSDRIAYGLALSPDGRHLYIATSDAAYNPSPNRSPYYLNRSYSVVAYDSDSGQQAWTSLYNSSPLGLDYDIPAFSTTNYLTPIVVSPDATRVFLTGGFGRPLRNPSEYGTVAYDTGVSVEPPGLTPTSVSFTQDSQARGQFSDQTYLEVRLADEAGDPIASRELDLELTGDEESLTATAITDESGLASWAPTLDVRPGSYRLSVDFDGDGTFEASSDSMAFLVEKEESALELTVAGKGKDRTLRAFLSDIDSSSTGISGRTIDFTADGEAIGSAVTGEDGVASLEVPPRYRGSRHGFRALFEGDDYYLASSSGDATAARRSGRNETVGILPWLLRVIAVWGP